MIVGYRLLCASSVAHSLFVRSLIKRKMIANGHRTPDNLLLETERNNVQQVFILTRNRPLNGVQTRVYFLLKQGVLTGVWVYFTVHFPIIGVGNTRQTKGLSSRPLAIKESWSLEFTGSEKRFRSWSIPNEQNQYERLFVHTKGMAVPLVWWFPMH